MRKKIYFTSDLHIGHENVMSFSNRPFKDLDHMHKVLINNFNAIVPKFGVTYFLGDIGLTRADTVKEVVEQLNGTKILILGNHDRGYNSMYTAGFDVVMHGATLQIAGETATLTHCPLRGLFRENTEGMKGAIDGENWHKESKHYNYSTQDRGQFHLHGHIHSPNGGKSKKIEGKQYDVGVDANNYRPVSISKIESWISNYKLKEKNK